MEKKDRAAVAQDVLQRVDAAAIDGRAHNIRYRQQQPLLLSAFVQNHADEICQAMTRDSGFSEEEAVFELLQSSEAIRTLYEQLDLQAALDEEYSIAKNKDNICARVPVGVVVIRPGQHSRLFSIISPAAAALSAGNCVIVEIQNSLRHLDTLLRSNLITLDPDAFAIISDTSGVSSLSSNCIIVDQTSSETSVASCLVSDAKALSIAIVDRTADVEQAATSICTGRFRFRGVSPYAPDVVLVNEWVREDFVSACLKLASIEAAAILPTEKPGAALNGPVPFEDKDDLTVLFDSKGVRMLEATRNVTLGKASGRTLVLVSISSLVDSISLVAGWVNNSIAACYCFGDLKTAKFLGQHIDSAQTYVNGIPHELLVGPIRPVTAESPQNLSLRYETNMMSRPSPKTIVKKGDETDSAKLLRIQSRKGEEHLQIVQRVREHVLVPLRPTGQGSGSSLGFFDQGIMTGFVAFVLPCLLLVGYGGFKTSVYVWRHLISSR